MKGPYERLKYELRRLWQCPLCHRKEWSSGAETARFCSCSPSKGEMPKPASVKLTPMQLVEDGARRIDYDQIAASRPVRSAATVAAPQVASTAVTAVAEAPPSEPVASEIPVSSDAPATVTDLSSDTTANPPDEASA